MAYIGRGPTNSGEFIILDDISSGFDGSDTSFTLTVGTAEVTPAAANVTIALDGVIQTATSAYSVTGSTINFTEAPESGQEFHGVLAGQSQYISDSSITNQHISGTANISGSKISTDFSAQVVKARVFDGMISGSDQIAASDSMTLATASIAAITASVSRIDSEIDTNAANITLATASIAAITASLGQPVNTDSNVTFGDITSTGTITATEIHTTFVSSSITVSSGSNIFGDDTSDIHHFTGSLRVTGSNFIISSSGNVGIATADPTTRLQIAGSSNEEDVILLEDNSGNDVGALRIHSNAFIMKGKHSSSPVQIQTHDGNEDIEVDPDGFIKFETAGGERMRITSGGNVEIKTTTAASTNSQSLPGYLQFSGFGWDTNSGSDPIGARITMGGSYSGITSGGVIPHLAFSIQNSGDAGSTSETMDEHMRIRGDGKVGIGTDTPLATFHVEHTTDDTDENGNIAMTVGGGASGNVRHYWGINNSGNYGYYGVVEHGTQYVPLILQPNGSNVGIGTSSPSGKLTIDQGGDDGEILTFKSSDVAHGVTARTETDTYGFIKKSRTDEGGVFLGGYTELDIGITLDATSTSDITDKNTGANGNILVRARKKDGTGDGQVGSNANLMAIENYDATRFIFDAEGDFHADNSSTTFDQYNDAQLVRAYDLSHGRGVIQSKFDDFVNYQHETLASLKLVGREKDGTPNNFVNVTGMQRLHNGAIWQQYTEMEKMKELMYDTMVQLLGKETADKKLEQHDIKLLDESLDVTDSLWSRTKNKVKSLFKVVKN